MQGFGAFLLSNGNHALILELCPTTVAAMLAQGRLLQCRQLRLAQGLAAGVCYLNTQGVIHRDLKPANIMVTLNDQVKVTDLGSALSAKPKAVGFEGVEHHTVSARTAASRADPV